MVSTQWSWESARLIALVLNALYGLEEYYNNHCKDLDVDGLFGLRIIQGHLRSIEENVKKYDVDSEIMAEIRNLSLMAGVIANQALPFVANRDREHFNQYQFLLDHPYKMSFTPQRTDERFRWREKELETGKADRIFPPHLLEKNNSRCFAELLANSNLTAEPGSCHLSVDCLNKMVNQNGFTGHHLTHQVLYFAVALQMRVENQHHNVPILHPFIFFSVLKFHAYAMNFQTACSSTLSTFSVSTRNQTVASLITEFCTNMIDELSVLLRNPKLIPRLNYDQRDLLMEQIFTCGQFGFVELSSLYFFTSVLSWQNPTSGCFTKDKTNNMANEGKTLSGSGGLNPDFCSTHSAAVAAGALTVFLHFLLDRGPWPEYYLADQPVVVYSIAAEEKFRQFAYGRWVRDSFIASIRHVRPPEVGWPLDLFAYFSLLSIMLGGFIVGHFCYKPKVKQIYHFSYKKL